MELDWSAEMVRPVIFPLILLGLQYWMYRGRPDLRMKFRQQYVWAGVIGGVVWAVLQTTLHYRRTQSFTWVFITGGLVWFASTIVFGWLLLKMTELRSRGRSQRKNEPRTRD